jgi:ABC-type polysaccharide/polyol phosphate transport system ATPase subunit
MLHDGLRPVRSIAVEVRNLSKNYPLEGSQLGRLRHLFGSTGRSADGIWALRDVTFSIERGEAFGIIGSNGSGKSTLLQIVAGILRPTSGSAEVYGRLSALLELGAGFSPEFTGRDNVYLNAALLGLSREETTEHFEEIERFADIGDFISQPIKTYSSGMVLRLAFAVAAHVDPEVLIVDEALAVGDIAFRQRCMRKIHDLRARGVTILFVSHETSDVKALCERCIWLDRGVAQALGEADEVVARYLSASLQREIHHAEPARREIPTAEPEEAREEAPAELLDGFGAGYAPGHRYGDGRATLVGAALIDGPANRVISPDARAGLRLSFRVNEKIESPIAGFLVRNDRGENIFGSNTARENYPLPAMNGGDAANVDFHWTMPPLTPGRYRISPAISDGNIEDFRVCDYIEDAIEFQIAAGAYPAPYGSRAYFQLRCAAVAMRWNSPSSLRS